MLQQGESAHASHILSFPGSSSPHFPIVGCAFANAPRSASPTRAMPTIATRTARSRSWMVICLFVILGSVEASASSSGLKTSSSDCLAHCTVTAPSIANMMRDFFTAQGLPNVGAMRQTEAHAATCSRRCRCHSSRISLTAWILRRHEPEGGGGREEREWLWPALGAASIPVDGPSGVDCVLDFLRVDQTFPPRPCAHRFP